MNIKNSKHSIMGFAGLLILIYHFIPIPQNDGIIYQVIKFIIQISYIGVDIFLFLSGYMIMFSDTDKYFEYIKRKIVRVYPLFFLCTLISYFLGKMSIYKLLRTIISIDIFINGGGAFLWFIQAIIILYLFAPLYKKLIIKYRNKYILLFTMLIYFLVMTLFEKMEYNTANIFLARLPIFVIGMYIAFYKEKIIKNSNIFIFSLNIIGIFMMWKYGYVNKLNYPFKDIFYIFSIPLVLGIVGIFNLKLTNSKSMGLKFLGRITLELYCLQMLLGTLIFNFLIVYLNNIYIVSILVIFSIIIISKIINILLSKIPIFKF